MTHEKRQIPRLNLRRPIDASLSGLAVALIDLSNGGAQIEHEVPLSAGGASTLEFRHEGSPVSVACQIVRTKLGRSQIKPGSFSYSSGLKFTNPSEDARAIVRHIVATMIKGMDE